MFGNFYEKAKAAIGFCLFFDAIAAKQKKMYPHGAIGQTKEQLFSPTADDANLPALQFLHFDLSISPRFGDLLPGQYWSDQFFQYHHRWTFGHRMSVLGLEIQESGRNTQPLNFSTPQYFILLLLAQFSFLIPP
jgi:hypothetical protein